MPIPKEMLWQWAQLPQFKRKVEKARGVIAEALAIAEKPIVAVSWGKDSVVMLHLCQRLNPDIKAVFSAGYFMETYDNFLEVQARYLTKVPTKLTVVDQSKDEALAPRHEPAPKKAIGTIDHDLVFLGLRKEESKNRRVSLCRYGELHQYQSGKLHGVWRCCPVASWSYKDIWAYTIRHDLPYLDSYEFQPLDRGRTTPHVTPEIASTSLGVEVKAALANNSPVFRDLLMEYSK
jgi:3'-phosphoadenosine 5'-phosphosulfate sulfotransferase (PAPS reductase)/FAD synthetase